MWFLWWIISWQDQKSIFYILTYLSQRTQQPIGHPSKRAIWKGWMERGWGGEKALKGIYNWIGDVNSSQKILHLQGLEIVKREERMKMRRWNGRSVGATVLESLLARSSPNTTLLSLFLSSSTRLFLFFNSWLLLFLNSWLLLFLNSPMLWLFLHFHHQSRVLLG